MTDEIQRGTGDAPVPFTWAGFRRGVRGGAPLFLGYTPVGFAFGVLATGAGAANIDSGLMSLLVYAGSSQFIAVDMAQAGIGVFSIIVTTFIVNLRHMLMAAAASRHLAGFSRPWLALFGAQMTDETFAVHMGRFHSGPPDKGEILGLNMAAHGTWVATTILGALFGDMLGDVRPYGLDYALSGMFIGLLLPHCRIPRRLAAALLSGFISVALALAGAAQVSVIAATALAATVIVCLPGAKGRHA